MHGVVEWPALIAIVSAIVFVTLTVSGFACWLLWKAWQELAKLRAELTAKIDMSEAGIEGRLSAMQTAVKADVNGIEARVRKMELEHVLGMATLKDLKDFQKAIEGRFDQLRVERREDMRGLHSRLNEFLMLPRTKEPGE